MADISAWRVNDVVAFEGMRESAIMLTALLLHRSTDGRQTLSSAIDEVTTLRESVLNTDSDDRAAVSRLSKSIDRRIIQLRNSQP